MTTQNPVPAYLSPDVCVAHFLAFDSDLPERFRYDSPVNLWRHRSEDGRWLPLPGSGLGAVIAAAVPVVHEALSATDVPLVFRALYAPAEDRERLEAVTDWDAERARRTGAYLERHRDRYLRWKAHEAHKERSRGALMASGGYDPRLSAEPFDYAPPPDFSGSLIGARQRERMLARCTSGRTIREALMQACHFEPFAYAPALAPVETDPRAWLASLPRTPGALTLRSALYDAYRDALPDGARYLDARRFHALARDAFGPAVRRHPGHFYYLGVSLSEEPVDRPLLRAV